MKKFLSLTLCLAVLLSCALIFAACDNCGKTNETEANTSAKTEAPTQAPAYDATEAPTETPTEAPTEEVTDPDEDGTEDGTTDGSGDNGDYDPEYYVVINSAEDLMNFNKAVNEDGEVYFDMTIVLTDDIDLTGYTWVPLDGYAFDYTTFDGNGHTISNMEIVHEPEQGTLADQIGAGFVGVARGDIYFEDITFDNCKVTAYERAIGCLIGCVTGGTMSFENVNVKNFTVDGWMDYANQDRENGGHPQASSVISWPQALLLISITATWMALSSPASIIWQASSVTPVRLLTSTASRIALFPTLSSPSLTACPTLTPWICPVSSCPCSTTLPTGQITLITA